MAYEFKFPDIGEGLTEGEIVEWKVKVGDKVEDHQTILEVETDKAVAEVPSPKAGYILELKGGPGDTINVGEVIAVIGDKSELGSRGAGKPEEKPEKEKKEKKPEKKEKEKAGGKEADKEKKEERPEEKKRESVGVVGELEEAPEEEEEEAPEEEEEAAKGKPKPGPAKKTAVKRESVGVVGELEEAPEEEAEEEAGGEEEKRPAPLSKPRVEALPKDRALARQLGVEIDRVRGTGPKGRVTEEDIKKAAERGAPEKGAPEAEGAPGTDKYGPVERVPLRGVRRKIAQAMVESLTKAAQVTTTDEADVGLLWHIRGKEKARAEQEGAKLTFLPFIIKAVVGALRRDPLMNSAMDDETGEIVVKGYYNIGVAVETRDGLIVPNVKDADKKSILQIAREVEALAEAARKRTLEIKDLKGGTFTITNYGSIGGLFGTPILNYPEAGILGVGRIFDKPVAEEGAIKIKKVLPLSLTFDHRVIDGAKAQHFMNNVIMHLEDPDLMLIG